MRFFGENWTKENIVAWHMTKASQGEYDGLMTLAAKLYCNGCQSGHRESGTIILFTRDVGMHSSGWWKNPDYERCLHLSLSFRDPATGKPRAKDQALTDEWLELFYGPLQRLMWTEPPFYPEGKRNDVWHYRVFYSPGWVAPILPRGEVYSKAWTPAHWLSYSDLQAKLGREAAKVEGYGLD
jgi:hypothetical protein